MKELRMYYVMMRHPLGGVWELAHTMNREEAYRWLQKYINDGHPREGIWVDSKLV